MEVRPGSKSTAEWKWGLQGSWEPERSGASETLRPLRLEDQCRENADGTLRAAAARGRESRGQAGDIRLPRLHPLLGNIAPGQSGGEERKRQRAVYAGTEGDQGMGLEKPAHGLERAAEQAQRAAVAGGETVAQMAGAAKPQQRAELAAVRLYVASVPADPGASHPLPNVNEPAT